MKQFMYSQLHTEDPHAMMYMEPLNRDHAMWESQSRYHSSSAHIFGLCKQEGEMRAQGRRMAVRGDMCRKQKGGRIGKWSPHPWFISVLPHEKKVHVRQHH